MASSGREKGAPPNGPNSTYTWRDLLGVFLLVAAAGTPVFPFLIWLEPRTSEVMVRENRLHFPDGGQVIPLEELTGWDNPDYGSLWEYLEFWGARAFDNDEDVDDCD